MNSINHDTLFAEDFLKCNNLRGSVTAAEARVLANLVARSRAKICLDIGVANGGSALAMAQYLAEIGGLLHGIDPKQIVEHNHAAEKLLARFGLNQVFKLHAMPTHLAAPKLLEEGVVFDLVFIDGMHCFEYKSIDAFFGDRMLRVGGHLVFHDAMFPSTKKVFRLLNTTGRFVLEQTPELHLNLLARLRRLVGALARGKSYPFMWPNGGANMIVLKKIADTDVAWDFFKDF
jgi:predicted O-methyltransferase YrrM